MSNHNEKVKLRSFTFFSVCEMINSQSLYQRESVAIESVRWEARYNVRRERCITASGRKVYKKELLYYLRLTQRNTNCHGLQSYAENDQSSSDSGRSLQSYHAPHTTSSSRGKGVYRASEIIRDNPTLATIRSDGKLYHESESNEIHTRLNATPRDLPL